MSDDRTIESDKRITNVTPRSPDANGTDEIRNQIKALGDVGFLTIEQYLGDRWEELVVSGNIVTSIEKRIGSKVLKIEEDTPVAATPQESGLLESQELRRICADGNDRRR